MESVTNWKYQVVKTLLRVTTTRMRQMLLYAPMLRLITIATENAYKTLTTMAYVTNWKYQGVKTRAHVTSTQKLQIQVNVVMLNRITIAKETKQQTQ